ETVHPDPPAEPGAGNDAAQILGRARRDLEGLDGAAKPRIGTQHQRVITPVGADVVDRAEAPREMREQPGKLRLEAVDRAAAPGIIEKAGVAAIDDEPAGVA